MAAGINDKVRKSFNAGNPEVTFVTSDRAAGATSLACDNLTGWPDNTQTAVDFVTYRLDTDGVTPKAGTQIDWKGIVSGNTITNLERVAGAADTGNFVNDVVEAMPTASWGDDIANALLGIIDQDGTVKAGFVDNAAALASNVITEPKLADNSVDSRSYIDGSIDPEHLMTGAGSSWAWQNWTPTWTNFTAGNGTLNYAKYTQVGKLVVARYKFTLGSTSSASGTIIGSLPKPSLAYGSTFQSLGSGVYYRAAVNQYYPINTSWESTNTFSMLLSSASGTWAQWIYVDNSTPAAPANGDYMQGFLIYEAA